MPPTDPQRIPHATADLHAELLAQLRALYPPLFDSDGKLSERELRAFVANYGVPEVERFEFRWAGKHASKRIAFTPSRARLRPNPKRGVDFNTTGNCIIEGDNLEVLKLLRKSYFGRVKCIYIDPPYNTGHDFVYSDNFTEGKQAYWEQNGVFRDGMRMDTNTESSGRYHSNWLNMMQSRLLLARQLLRDDGVIFVSIDDHEVHNLRKLMDEVFGEENFVAQIVWQSLDTVKNDAQYFSDNHEYIVCYAKEKTSLSLLGVKKTEKQSRVYKNPDNDSRGPYLLTPLHAKSGSTSSVYEYKFKNGVAWHPPAGTFPRFSRETLGRLEDDNRIYFGRNGNGGIPQKKTFLSEVSDRMKLTTFWDYQFAGSTRQSNQEIADLLGKGIFENVKPTSLIHLLLDSCTDNGDLIFDFFAGSGTTAHAVMELNKEDGGNRKFILVQLPEETDEQSEARKAGYNTISQITIERVKRAGAKIKAEKPEVDTGFRVFELTKSLFPDTAYARDPEKTDAENVAALKEVIERSRQALTFPFDRDELLAEIALKDGFDATYTATKQDEFTDNVVVLLSDASKSTRICLDHEIAMPTVDRLIKDHKSDRFICLSRALDTTKQWKLHHSLGSSLWVT